MTVPTNVIMSYTSPLEQFQLVLFSRIPLKIFGIDALDLSLTNSALVMIFLLVIVYIISLIVNTRNLTSRETSPSLVPSN